jgi:hypothetical protein
MKSSAKYILVFVILQAFFYGCAINNPPSTKNQKEGFLELSYSDGSAATYGVDNINAVLSSIGVRVSTLLLPNEASQLLKTSEDRSLTTNEAKEVLRIFSLDRNALVDQIKEAGRKPAVDSGGLLSTSEVGVAPYPKVYDMMTLSPEIKVYLQNKFGKLHVNSADGGVGIDEVMTLVSGGPYIWFFVLPNNVVVKLTFGHVSKSGHAWRISYPGLVPHGAFLDGPPPGRSGRAVCDVRVQPLGLARWKL